MVGDGVVGGGYAGGVRDRVGRDGAVEEGEEGAVDGAVVAEGRGVEDGDRGHEQARPPWQRGFPRRRRRIRRRGHRFEPSGRCPGLG